jgi:hypothetical protein
MSKKSLQFHIKSDDYFGTLATIIDLQVQRLRPETEGVNIFEFLKILEEANEVLEEKVKELMYLQKNYRLVKRH